jgi:hypothetical protein
MYPSVPSEGQGFNLALHPDLFEDGSIELKRAGFVRVYCAKDNRVIWDWTENAEYIEGQKLSFIPIPNTSMSEVQLLSMLKKYNMEHLF